MSIFVGALQQVIARIPPWFIRGRYGSAFLEAIGLTLDVSTETLTRGLRQRYPLACEDASLSVVGGDVGIVQRGTETNESYRVRCAKFRQIKKHAGSHYGQMINLQPYFLPGTLPTIYCVHQAGDGSSATWHKMDPNGVYSYSRATPSNFDFDGVPEKWSREFWFIETAGTRLDVGGVTHYNDGNVYNGGQVYDGVTAASGADMKAILDESKAAHTIIWSLALTASTIDPTATAAALPDGSTTLPQGNWGPLIDPTTHAPTRPSYLEFYFDLGQG
jgi:hypothetical protein